MKLIHTSKILDLAIAGFCIMALLIGAASAAGTGGAGGNNPPAQVNGVEKYTMDQTLSDRGQQATIAFDALAFVSGDACSDTFLPPGKVADYAGFQYLRDNDVTQMGHNTDFVTRISDNVLSIMTADQLSQFSALSETEAPLSTQYGYMRYPLTKAFRAQMDGTIPTGSSGLDKAAVMAYSAKLYDVDATIAINRAKTYASVIRSMTPTQLAYLDTMKSTGMASMPVVDSSGALKNAGQGNSVAMRTYASEMFAWYAGSVEADTYFCPERQATYFGSFYMKDAPAMGNAGYSISTTLTGDSGENFLNLLTADQRAKVTGLVELQRSDLNEIVAKRTAISTELRKALAGSTIDEAAIRALSARYGELDGEISWYYATHFAEVAKTLTSEQKTKAVALRNLAGYTCQGGYLYSQPIAYPANVPSDFLFGVGTYDPAQMASWVSGQQTSTLQTGPGNGNSERKQGNVTGQGQGNGQRPGNTTRQGQGNSGQQGGTMNPAGQGQAPRMTTEEVIVQLQQKGYDVSGVSAALQSGDQDAMKTWMGQFKKSNPGVTEGIEGTMTGNSPARNNGAGTPNTGQPGRNAQPADKGVINSINTWFENILKSLWGGNQPAPSQ
jgi:Spy/CpxP family protein refolding chaperone